MFSTMYLVNKVINAVTVPRRSELPWSKFPHALPGRHLTRPVTKLQKGTKPADTSVDRHH